DELGNAEDADGDVNVVDAIEEVELAEGEARRSRIHVGADETEKQAEDDHRQRLDDRAMRERDGADKTEHHQGEVFGGLEAKGELGQRYGEDDDDEGGHCAGEKGADRGNGKGGSGATLTRHLIAV